MRFLLFILLLISCLSAVGQTPFAKEFSLNESNEPVKVNDMMQDSSGYIWIGTDKGLYRFNGRRFTPISDTIKAPVTALALIEGVLWVGYNDGRLGMVSNNYVIPVKIAGKAPHSSITSIHSTRGLLCITTNEEGVFIVINGIGVRLTTDDGLTDNFIYAAYITPDEIIVTTDRGINHIRWNGKRPYVEVFTTAQGLPDNIVRVFRPIPGTRLSWIGTQEGGLAIYDDGNETIRRLKLSSAWGWGQVNDVLAVSADEAWVATEDGYLLDVSLQKDSMNVQPFVYPGKKLKKLIGDKAGNIWCATNQGLMMSTGNYAAQTRLGAEYQLKKLTAVACGQDNVLWFSQNDELYKLVPGSTLAVRVLRAPAALSYLYYDSDGLLWVGTFGKGLFYLRGGRLVPINNIAEIKDGHVLSIAAARDHLWIATLNGVEETVVSGTHQKQLKWLRHHDKLSGTGSDYVYQLYPDRRGNMWMATDGGGVCMFDGRSYHRWDSSEGFTSQVVYTLTEDLSGNIWAGTLGKGLFRFDGKRWTRMDEGQGLMDLNITSIRSTASGQVIVVNQEGIDQWYPASGQFRHYNRRLGVDIDSTSAVLNCITSDSAGNVVVPFEHGFISFRNIHAHYDINPGISINAIDVFFKPVLLGRREFTHKENHITFRFDGINFTNPERLRYRYKLEGYDDNWIYTNDEVIPFPQLPAGDFYFRVQASLNTAFSGAREDSYRFSVSAPFWERAWFLALVVLALAGAGYGYIRLREKGLRQMSKLQKERMMFEYEHLKSQVNPHFLFNSLNTLVSLIEDDKDAAVDYTVHLSDLYRNMLSFRDKDLIALADEYEIIMNYMYVQRSRFGEALRMEVDIPGHLLHTGKIVPLALQLLVENAIKHNVVSLSMPLTIYIKVTETEIIVRNRVQPKVSKEKGAGLGILNIKNRYALLTSREVKFGIFNNEYIVILPLL